MKLLLITGAGASRNLGVDGPMPLMPDWSDAICEALSAIEPNLASACHLTTGMAGLEFETNLGLLLRWEQVRHLEKRFQDLGGGQAGSHLEQIEAPRANIDRRMALVMRAINVTLYEQFGQKGVDDEKAARGFGALLRHLDMPDLILATTNYDRSGETALATLGYDVDTGFRAQPNRMPVFDPTGADFGQKVPVLHLHGAVGWYEQEGLVGEYPADQPFNSSLGTPVVLYPDPEKDPTSDAVVSRLWTGFNKALDAADAVLVIGHSLHDPPLVRTLQRVASSKPVVISYFVGDGPEVVESVVGGALGVKMSFGPEIEVDGNVQAMLETRTRPAVIGERPSLFIDEESGGLAQSPVAAGD
jgi:hypothetical protein